MKKKDQNKTLYVIGNGFDIAHGLNTCYWKFREFLEEKAPIFLNSFESLYNVHTLDDTEPWYTDSVRDNWNNAVNNILWSEFELNMGRPETGDMVGQWKTVTEGMRTYDIKFHMDLYWKEQYGFISELQGYVKEWIESIDTKKVCCKKRSLIGSEDLFFNFNYTDVLEKKYDVQNVLHIHGGVGKNCDTPPFMGHCNMEDIVQHRKWAREAAEEGAEAEASVLDAVANYLQEIYKDTDEYIQRNHLFFERLSKVTNVVVYGWSGGNVDIPYIKEIIKNTSTNAKWIVYWYNKEDYQRLRNFFDGEGIKDKEIIEYIQSDNFWDYS